MMRDDMTSLSFWTGQHKDEQDDNLYSVWRDEQDWSGGFLPRTIKCERIYRGLSREYADTLRKSLEANEDIGRSVAQQVARSIEFVLDCDENRENLAENPALQVPIIY